MVKLMKFLLRVAEKLFKKAFDWNRKVVFSDKCLLALVALIMMITFASILSLEPMVKKLGTIAYCLLVVVAVSKFIKFIKNGTNRT